MASSRHLALALIQTVIRDQNHLLLRRGGWLSLRTLLRPRNLTLNPCTPRLLLLPRCYMRNVQWNSHLLGRKLDNSLLLSQSTGLHQVAENYTIILSFRCFSLFHVSFTLFKTLRIRRFGILEKDRRFTIYPSQI